MDSQLNFIRPYLRGWVIIVLCMMLAFMAASKYLSYVTPMYESTAKLRLADLNEGVPNSNLYKDLDVFANTQKINAEIELIKSHSIVKKALQKVPFETVLYRKGSLKNSELFSDAPFKIKVIQIEKKWQDKPLLLRISGMNQATLYDPSGIGHQLQFGDTLNLEKNIFWFEINKELLDLKPETKVVDDYIIVFNSEERLLSDIINHLDVISVDKDVPVIRISYKSQHPEKAALFPNSLAEAYIEDYIQTKYGAANVTSTFLNDRINEISQKLAGSEAAILRFRNKEGITNIRQETETDLRKISQLKIQQTNLKMSLDAIVELDQYMEKGKDNFLELAPNFEAFTDLLSTEMIKKVKQLQAEKKDLLLEYTPTHERVKTIDHKIYDISSYLNESIGNTRKNLETKYKLLVNDIEEAEKVFIDVPEKERIMTILNRDFEIYQQSYNFLNQKKIEAEIAKAAKVAFHRVITPASKSKQPVSPNTTIIKGVSVILGLLGAIILIFIVHSLKARVNNVYSVEANSLIPVCAKVPKIITESEKRRTFLNLLSQWQVKGLLKPQNIMTFTGFNQKHGVDFIALGILETLQKQGKKILLIEMDNHCDNEQYYKEEILAGQIQKIILNCSKMEYRATEEIQNMVIDKSKDVDHTIIVNSNFGAPFTLVLMAISHFNIVCLDTRLTPFKKIAEANLITEEYKLPNVHFAVNRDNYNPGFISEVYRTIKKLFTSLLNK